MRSVPAHHLAAAIREAPVHPRLHQGVGVAPAQGLGRDGPGGARRRRGARPPARVAALEHRAGGGAARGAGGGILGGPSRDLLGALGVDGGAREGETLGDVAFGSSIDIDNGYALIGQASDGQAGLAYVVRLP